MLAVCPSGNMDSSAGKGGINGVLDTVEVCDAPTGCGGIVIVINPILQENKNTLEIKEFLGTDTSGDHQTVAIQTVAFLFGFIAGTPFTLLGIVLIVLALSHNNRLDAMKQGQERSQSGDAEPTPSQERSFCGYCGEPTEGKPFCVHCGKRI